MQRGFTLIELTWVLAVMGALVAITVPSYRVLLRRAEAAEARAVLQAIAHAEHQHYRDRGAYLACAPTGEVPLEPAPFPADEPCWKALGIRLEGTTAYRYGVSLQDGSFTATAEGDLDGDGTASRFAMRGSDLVLQIEDELE